MKSISYSLNNHHCEITYNDSLQQKYTYTVVSCSMIHRQGVNSVSNSCLLEKQIDNRYNIREYCKIRNTCLRSL